MKKFLIPFAIALAAITGAQAQTWPSKPVTLVVPFPPGGSTDRSRVRSVRITAQAYRATFIVDNKPGATGTIGAVHVKRAAPDGYTFLVTSLGPLVIVPHLIKAMQYDALKDFDLITVAVQAPNVLVVPANLRTNRLLMWLRTEGQSRQDELRFAGNGSSDHLTAELFWLKATRPAFTFLTRAERRPSPICWAVRSKGRS